ncbi:aquaporin [Streptomyces mirabilis]|uniref:aquaporin n=1 Tax=Streptomyces mirabilis TaxID=68239 RepID=UPI0036D7F0DD
MRGGTVVGWREVFSEFAGTALLLLFGLSAIVMDFSQDSPMMSLIPSGGLRRLLTAAIFSLCGTLIIYSPLGRISGGHINPAVTVAFLRLGKISAKSAIAYIVAQVAGAAAGAVIVSFIWGHRVKNSRLMVTVPGPGGTWAALAVETAATFLLISLILVLLERPRLMPFAAAAAGALGVILVFLAAPVSGAGLNPARSLAPAAISNTWDDLWVYLLAPVCGSLSAAIMHQMRRRTIPCGKLIHDRAYVCHLKNCLYSEFRRTE